MIAQKCVIEDHKALKALLANECLSDSELRLIHSGCESLTASLKECLDMFLCIGSETDTYSNATYLSVLEERECLRTIYESALKARDQFVSKNTVCDGVKTLRGLVRLIDEFLEAYSWKLSYASTCEVNGTILCGFSDNSIFVTPDSCDAALFFNNAEEAFINGEVGKDKRRKVRWIPFSDLQETDESLSEATLAEVLGKWSASSKVSSNA